MQGCDPRLLQAPRAATQARLHYELDERALALMSTEDLLRAQFSASQRFQGDVLESLSRMETLLATLAKNIKVCNSLLCVCIAMEASAENRWKPSAMSNVDPKFQNKVRVDSAFMATVHRSVQLAREAARLPAQTKPSTQVG